jgi:hypothetical protein
VAHQCPQRRAHLLAALVQIAGPNGAGQLRFVVEPQAGQRFGDVVTRFGEQFPLDDAQHVGGNPGVEIDLAGRRLADVGLEKLGHGCDKFSRGRTPMQSHQDAGASAPRSTPVRSFTDAE